jgi:hypothetical protein
MKNSTNLIVHALLFALIAFVFFLDGEYRENQNLLVIPMFYILLMCVFLAAIYGPYARSYKFGDKFKPDQPEESEEDVFDGFHYRMKIYVKKNPAKCG